MTTPDEAKARWCPFVRILAGDEDGLAGINARHDRKREETAYCISTRCMAWRLHPPPVSHTGLDDAACAQLDALHVDEHIEMIEDDPAEDGSQRWVVWVGPQGGFCGLAGAAGAP